MTPSQIEEFARQRYNAIGDTNWSSSEMLRLMDQASMQLAREALVIEQVYTTTTVSSQQEYTYPSNTIAIKRITYEGGKLQPIDMRQYDQLSLNNTASTVTGTPQFYFVWNEVIYLHPTPSASGTLKIFSFNEPQALSTTSTLEIPSQFHMDLVDYILAEMYAKDKDFSSSRYYREIWEKRVMDAKKWQRRRLRGDSFATVQNEEVVATTLYGMV